MPLQVTEKTDACMDNLRVGLELWDKQLSLGGEVDSWAGAKLALFAESHPFHNQQHVSDMKVSSSEFWKKSSSCSNLVICLTTLQEEICKNEDIIEHFHKKSVEIQEMLQSQEAPLELQVSTDLLLLRPPCMWRTFMFSSRCSVQVMEGHLRKRMQQVKELFNDCADVFEELIAVKTHLAEKIEECHSAVENIQSSLNAADPSEPNVEVQIQVRGSETTLRSSQAPVY